MLTHETCRLRGAAAALAVLALSLCRCVTPSGDDRQAGTSTTVGNTVGAVALANGQPAAGAEVFLRNGQIHVSAAGVPYSRLLAFAVVDSQGRFSLPKAEGEDFYLEVREAPEARPFWARDSLQTLLIAYPQGLPAGDELGDFILRIPGGLSGKLFPNIRIGPVILHPDQRWVGAQGTDNFVRADADGSFRLNGLAPGHHALAVVDVPDSTSTTPDTSLQVTVGYSSTAFEIRSGFVTLVDSIPLTKL